MNLQYQVCTIEQAKKLKELGVKQESITTWYEDMPTIGTVVMYTVGDISVKQFAAFTCAELGIMIGSYNENDMYEINGETYPTEAQARAALLIHLIENKIVEVSEINDRLNK